MIKFFSFLLILSLSFPSVAWGMEPPQQPENLTYDTVIQYNTKVEEYNDWVIKQNTKLERQYQKEVNKINEYNQEQDKLLEENKIAIQKQEEIEKKIAEDANLDYTYQTKEFPSWNLYELYLTDKPLTMKLNKTKGLPGDAFAVDAHIYLKEGAPQPNISLEYDHLVFNDYEKDNVLVYEGECSWVNVNENIEFENQLSLLNSPDGRVYRFFEGYTNGYWQVVPVIVGQNIESIEHSNIFNTIEAKTLTKHQSVGVVYYYNFVRTGPEPEAVEPFTPIYKELPQSPTYYNSLPLLDVPEKQETNQQSESVQQELKPNYTKPVVNTLPPTGDNMLINILICCLIIMSICSICLLILKWKNNKKQKEFYKQLREATTPEELLNLAKAKGYELSDAQLKSVTDPSDWSHCPLYDDRPCPDHFYCIRH